MNNYFEYWYKRMIKDGLKWIKAIIGFGLVICLGHYINVGVGILFFGWVLTESLIDKN